MEGKEDILSRVQNHLYNLVIESQSKHSISRHVIRNPHYIDPTLIPSKLSLLYYNKDGIEQRYECKDPSKWMLLCEFIGDTVVEHFSDEMVVNIGIPTTSETLTILGEYISYIRSIPILPSDIIYDGYQWIYPSRKNEMILYNHTGNPLYMPVDLFHIKIRKYIRDEDYEWFLYFLHKKSSTKEKIIISERNSPIDSLNWRRVQQLMDTVEIANFIGCESFSVYTFLFLYGISVSLSCIERELLFGHKYFMLPIEGWDHPLRQLYHIPFLQENDVENCTDEKYLDVAKECEI